MYIRVGKYKLIDSSKFLKLIGLGLVKVARDDSYLDLGDPKIEEIGSDHYHSFKTAGVSILFRNRKLVHAQFYNGNKPGFNPFVGTLPLKIEFSYSKAEVREKVGEPSKTTGSPKSNWDIYDSEGKSIHVQYDLDGNVIEMITLQEQF